MDMPSIIFSVSPIAGFKSVRDRYGNKSVVQSEPARSRSCPDRRLVNVRVRACSDGFWGGPESKTYISKPLTDPSWKRLKAEARKAMKSTGDWHHQFLEGVGFTGKFHKDGSEYVELHMGS